MERSFEPVATRRTFEEAVEQIAEKIKAGDLPATASHPSASWPPRCGSAGRRCARPSGRWPRPACWRCAEASRADLRGVRADPARAPALLARRSASRRSPACSRRDGCSSRAAQLAATHASDDDFAVMRHDRASARARASDDFLRHEDLFLQLDLKFHWRWPRHAQLDDRRADAHLLRQLEIARDMAMHAPLVPDWTIEIHERTRRRARRRLRVDRRGDGRAPRPARADLGAGDGRAWSARCPISSSPWRNARGRCGSRLSRAGRSAPGQPPRLRAARPRAPRSSHPRWPAIRSSMVRPGRRPGSPRPTPSAITVLSPIKTSRASVGPTPP